MSCELDHIALANKNHCAMMCLHEDKDSHPEWVATIAFYKAVHIIQAVLSNARKSRHDHKSRHAVLKSNYPEIWKHYRPLWAASTIARYLYDNDSKTPYTSFSDHCPSDKVFPRLVRKRLRSVEDLSLDNLSTAAKDALVRVPAG